MSGSATRPKLVISGSSALQGDIARWKSHFEERGFEVTAIPGPWDSTREPTEQLTEVYTEFYAAIEDCDTFFVMNEDKGGVDGYIGASATAELVYAVVLNLLKNKGIAIHLAKAPGPNVFAYDEVMNYLRAGWVTYYEPDESARSS